MGYTDSRGETELGDYTPEEEPGGDHAEPHESGDYTPEEEPGGDHAEPQEIPPKTVDLKTPDWICRCGIDCKQMRHLVQAMQQCGIYHRQHDTANQKKGMSNEPFRHSKIS